MAKRQIEDGETSLRDRLLNVAEALYAEGGFSGVSLRQICVAAGAKNNSAVQYHFGDQLGLVAAIVKKQQSLYETRRAEHFIRVSRDGPLTPRIILEILNTPILDQLDEFGEPIGARFMVALQNTAWGWQPLSAHLSDAPVARQLIKSLEQLLPDLPPPVVWQRLYLTSLLIMNCAAQLPRSTSERFQKAVMENAFRMGGAALAVHLDREDCNAMTELHTLNRGFVPDD